MLSLRKIQKFICRYPIFTWFCRLLAYIKNDVFGYKLPKELAKRLVPGWEKMSILDVGSGPCYVTRDKRFLGKNIICLDIHQPYLKECKKFGFKTLNIDAKKVSKYFSPGSVDIVLCMDFLEHLKKREALKLLYELEQIARHQIIIFGPLGYVPADKDEFGRTGNPYRVHRSFWEKEEFERLGYQCEVLKGYHKDIRGGYSKHLSDKPLSADAVWAIKIK